MSAVGSDAGVYLADLERQRRDARQWRGRMSGSFLGVFLRLKDDDGHVDAIDRLQPVGTDETASRRSSCAYAGPGHHA